MMRMVNAYVPDYRMYSDCGSRYRNGMLQKPETFRTHPDTGNAAADGGLPERGDKL